MHLWEAKHPYYCNEGNFYKNGCGHDYASWADFVAEMGSADLDMNLLFRFDWEESEDAPHAGDIYYRDGHLLLFFMGQRKGLYWWCDVGVCRADEPQVLEYLRIRFDHMKTLWEPLSNAM
jgi:hypothetical protein